MPYNPAAHHRRSIRLREYDYRTVGAYFITICTYGRECILGHIHGDAPSLSGTGQMVLEIWLGMPQYHPGVEVDESVVMPNHVHSIVWIAACAEGRDRADSGRLLSLPELVQRFKSLTTTRYRVATGVGRLWQRNYYERVIRNESELDSVRQYIAMNPARWAEDTENPERNR